MALTKYKLGDLIHELYVHNTELRYGIESVRGISNSKEIMASKADVDESVLHKFYVVYPGEFIYNPRTTRMGDKVGLAYNNTTEPLLFSFNNIAFAIKDSAKEILLGEYLYLYFNRSEFDRYAITNSWGSATELFTFEEMRDIDIELPDLPTQQKYVDIYKAMVANQQSYERGLEDLKLVCDGYIEDLRKKMPCKKIGQYIERHDFRNGPNGTKNVMGISTSKCFREPTSKVNKDELANYKVCSPRQFGFVQTTHNEKVFTYAFNNTDEDIVISSVNEVFSTHEDKLYPEYLCMFFNRTEFDRYARFHSWGSARETFTWSDLIEVEIPIPDIEIQKSIASVYSVYVKRKEINEQLKAQIKDICPILIRGSLEEGK